MLFHKRIILSILLISASMGSALAESNNNDTQVKTIASIFVYEAICDNPSYVKDIIDSFVDEVSESQNLSPDDVRAQARVMSNIIGTMMEGDEEGKKKFCDGSRDVLDFYRGNSIEQDKSSSKKVIKNKFYKFLDIIFIASVMFFIYIIINVSLGRGYSYYKIIRNSSLVSIILYPFAIIMNNNYGRDVAFIMISAVALGFPVISTIPWRGFKLPWTSLPSENKFSWRNKFDNMYFFNSRLFLNNESLAKHIERNRVLYRETGWEKGYSPERACLEGLRQSLLDHNAEATAEKIDVDSTINRISLAIENKI